MMANSFVQRWLLKFSLGAAYVVFLTNHECFQRFHLGTVISVIHTTYFVTSYTYFQKKIRVGALMKH